MRLLELQYTFRVEHAETEQVSVTFSPFDRTVLCSSFLYSGSVKERVYRTSLTPSPELATRVAENFLTGLHGSPRF